MENDTKLELKNISNELKYLLELIKSHKTNGLGEEPLPDIDWNLFLQLAQHHRVFPLLYSKMVKVKHHGVPPFVVEKVYQEYRKNIFWMLHLSSEMEQVCNMFTENNIANLVLKGPVLGKEIYGDISLRTSSDLDIMVPINDVEQVEKLLIINGYEQETCVPKVIQGWKWRFHHDSYFHPQKGVKLEIHWRLHPIGSMEPSFQELWNRKKAVNLSTYPVYMLGEEDLFLFLVSHGARHGWSRLRWLIDIDQMIRHDFDWDYTLNLLKKYQYLPIAGQAIILAKKLLNSPIQLEIYNLLVNNRSKQLAEDALFYLREMVNLHAKEPIPQHVAKYHRRHLYSQMSYRQKALCFLNILYPFPVDIEAFPLPEHLHFLYIPLRPFLWARRKMEKA